MDQKIVPLPLSGGCVCGAVQFEPGGAPLLVHACHCHNCQSRTGSAFSIPVLVRAVDLKF